MVRNMQIPGKVRPPVSEQFGKKLREAREGKGLSQRAVSERLQAFDVTLDHTAIARIEQGKREPKLGEAVALSAACGLNLEDTLFRSPAVEVAVSQTFVRDVMTSARESLVMALDALLSILETPVDHDGYYSLEQMTGVATVEEAARKAIDLAEESIRALTSDQRTVSVAPSLRPYVDQAVGVFLDQLTTLRSEPEPTSSNGSSDA